MMKQVLIVYFSKFVVTQMVAERVAQTVAGKLASADSVQLINSSELDTSDLGVTDLVIMGNPTYNMNLPKVVKEVIEGLPRKSIKGVRFTAFDTSHKMSWWLDHFTAAMQIAR